ncbi:hypothetical protein D9758_004484 [Tetrapyrgos nigripes]|uniref:G-protein coupled receptors family 2 profile 2 domain-containing protein n=1 Tax=Tetrapyrgos nigripes TaxID=182062 RepID=A0A8H5LSJ6_9AGAR|nr:hypothetical protein D9758_004484 [Tetrapyrgos nigripes]
MTISLRLFSALNPSMRPRPVLLKISVQPDKSQLRTIMSSPISVSQFNFAGTLGYACTIPGTCLCFLILVAYVIVGLSPAGRAQMDRVSFRLLSYSLFFNILYGIAFSVTAAQSGPGSLCTFGAWAVNFTLTFTIYFTMCIALNLLYVKSTSQGMRMIDVLTPTSTLSLFRLVLVYRVNGRRMEKYYVIGTIIISIVLTVPAYGLHQFGWNEANSTCWFRNPDDHLRLRWLVGTQGFWMLLAATVETASSIIVLTWLFRNQMYLHQLRSNDNTTTTQTSTMHRLWGGNASTSAMIHQANRYRYVIYRISLYPIVSLIINVITTALDVNQTVKGVNTQGDFRLLVLDLFLYGIRTFVYAILAAADPSFINAIRAMRGKLPATQTPHHDHTELHSMPQGPGQTPEAVSGNDHHSVNSSIRKRTSAADDEAELEEDWEFQRQL